MGSSPFEKAALLGTLTAGVWVGVTTGTGPPVEINAGPQDLTVTYTSVGTTSGGTILLEETDDIGSGATWSQIETTAASSFTGSAKSCHHVRIGRGLWVRARISSDITGGGTVYVTLSGS